MLQVATVLTACGIETWKEAGVSDELREVATVLTACGIETNLQLLLRLFQNYMSCNSTYRLRY